MKWHQDYTVKETQKQKKHKNKNKKKHKNRNKNTKTETKTQKQKQKQQPPKKGRNKESFPLTRCWRHVLWADDVKLLLSAQGEIKSRASIIIYDGGGEETMKEGSHGFEGNRGGGETVIANRVQRGGL